MPGARLFCSQDGEPLGVPILWRRSIIEAGEQQGADRVEVLGGDLLGRPQMTHNHAAALAGLLNVVRKLHPKVALFTVQDALLLDSVNLPRPDLMLIRPREDFYQEGPPVAKDAFLILEISENPDAYELPVKMPLYAAHQVPRFWVMDLRTNSLIKMEEPDEKGYRIMNRENGGSTAAGELSQLMKELSAASPSD